MQWSTIDFKLFLEQLYIGKLRKPKKMGFLKSCVSPLQPIHEALSYKMQHNGQTIYLEKVLNDWFEVVGYDPINHQETKTVFIEDLPRKKQNYIFQPNEEQPLFLQDAPNENDIFINAPDENQIEFTWSINIPDTYVFTELDVRNLVDEYRFIGQKYIIKTYTL